MTPGDKDPVTRDPSSSSSSPDWCRSSPVLRELAEGGWASVVCLLCVAADIAGGELPLEWVWVVRCSPAVLSVGAGYCGLVAVFCRMVSSRRGAAVTPGTSDALAFSSFG